MKNNKQYDVVICGSGFGGSVSALRMAQKGYKVLLLEKGKRYRTEDFPKTNWNLKKFLWFPNLFLYGIQCITFLKHVFILHGTGVGGGSLVYANTLLVPDDEAFADPRWTDKKWKDKLAPFYKIAQKMLGVTKSKHMGYSDMIIKDVADQMGREDTFSEVNVGVYFGEKNQEKLDPYFDGKGPERSACILCGECMVGCRHNSKNTLDKNYLYFAEKLGVDIQPESEVVDINYNNNQYIITYKKSTGIIRPKYKIKANKVILSGGVMGTVKLLFKCKSKGSLEKVSNELGNYIRTNSEAILAVRSKKFKESGNLNKGIAISAGFKPDDNTYVETCRYGKGQNSMSLLTTHLVSRKGRLWGGINWFTSIMLHPIKYIKASLPYNWSSETVILLVMQPINNYLKFTYKSRWWRFWSRSMNSTLSSGNPIPSKIPIGEDVANIIADKYNGVTMTSYMDSFFSIPTTAHILGGACIGKDKYSGVINENFEVFNYPNLYVVDGSMIPANLGVNPSLTITAMAEYAMSKIEEKNL